MGLLEPHVGYGCGDGEADLTATRGRAPDTIIHQGRRIMSDRIEPNLGIDPTGEPAPAPKASSAPSANSRTALDQLARIEDKMARMEEKFSRQDASIARAQDSLDRAATRVESAARSVDAAELAAEVAKMRAEVAKVPRLGGLVITGLVTALATALVFILILKLFPGLLK